ncbi:MAG: hypothetical protein QXX68_00345 [Candidatus Pacearchaeota archaeon]
MKKKQKRGQFFLIAALIIILIAGSLFAFRNRVNVFYSSDFVISLKNQLSEESSVVIDYGLITRDDKLEDFLGKFSSSYLSQNPDLEFIFFYGKGSNLSVLNLAKKGINISVEGNNYFVDNVQREGAIQIGRSGANVNIDLRAQQIKDKIFSIKLGGIPEKKIRFRVDDIPYEIPLDKYKNFYFVIKREKDEERHVAIE